MSEEPSMNNTLENWIDGRTWGDCMEMYEGVEVHSDWGLLVKRCENISLYPLEKPKMMINFMHELLNWVACHDSGYENPPEYHQGERAGEIVGEDALATMRWYFQEILTEQAIDGLRNVRPWVD